MRGKWKLFGALVLATSLGAGGLAAAKKAAAKPAKVAKTKKPPPVKEMSKDNAKALADFQGKFKWGLTHEEVIKVLSDQLQPPYDEKIAATSDTYTQDQIRARFKGDIKRIRDSYVKFDGQKTGWDVSLIDREFGQKNDESMLLLKELNQTRFFFFVDDKLWKEFIAFDAGQFEGKTFEDFKGVFESRFGNSTPVQRLTATGKPIVDEFVWPPAGGSVLRALDLTKFHGNFVLTIADKNVSATIQARREERNPAEKKGGGMVESVTTPSKSGNDPDSNENVLDDIVGKKKP